MMCCEFTSVAVPPKTALTLLLSHQWLHIPLQGQHSQLEAIVCEAAAKLPCASFPELH